MTTLPRIGRRRDDPIVNEIRAIDGCRSPWFLVEKRSIHVHELPSHFAVELAERRVVTLPVIRVPVFYYWRTRTVRGQDMGKLGIVARAFLETGHLPAQWWI